MFGGPARRIYGGGASRQSGGGRMGPKPLMQPGRYGAPPAFAQSYDDFPVDDYGNYGVESYGGGYLPKKKPAGGLSSDTNSRDPKHLQSRVFVGNVNTQLVDKLQLEKIYSQFGALKAISVHKGFAFIQFANETDARTAVKFTDGMSLVGQDLDVNMANEPKPDRSVKAGNALKRIKMDSEVSQPPPYQPPPVKCPDFTQPLMTVASSVGAAAVEPVEPPVEMVSAEQIIDAAEDVDLSGLLTYDTPDTLICGRCRKSFELLLEFKDHKKHPCEPSSEKEPIQIPPPPSIGSTDSSGGLESATDPGPLKCFICKCDTEFSSWELLKHLSSKHNMTVWLDRKD